MSEIRYFKYTGELSLAPRFFLPLYLLACIWTRSISLYTSLFISQVTLQVVVLIIDQTDQILLDNCENYYNNSKLNY